MPATPGHAPFQGPHPAAGPALIAGLPIGSWLLILIAVGLGLAIELVFYLRHRRCRPADRSGDR
jgi:hypothetical protein